MAETPRQAWENRRLERRRSNTSRGDFSQKLWDTGPTRNSDSDMLTMVRVAVAKQDNTCRTTASGVEFGSMPGNGSVDPEMLKSTTEAHQKNTTLQPGHPKNPARGPRIGWSENRQNLPEIPMFRWKQMWPSAILHPERLCKAKDPLAETETMPGSRRISESSGGFWRWEGFAPKWDCPMGSSPSKQQVQLENENKPFDFGVFRGTYFQTNPNCNFHGENHLRPSCLFFQARYGHSSHPGNEPGTKWCITKL